MIPSGVLPENVSPNRLPSEKARPMVATTVTSPQHRS
jgi:hypothetical protein